MPTFSPNSPPHHRSRHLIDGKYGICDLVDMARLQRLLERFSQTVGLSIGLADYPGLKILLAINMHPICTRFHRNHPASAQKCQNSNRRLFQKLHKTTETVVETCDNGLVDCAVPIIIAGKHIASLVTGQMLLQPADNARFRAQAQAFGYDESAYLHALGDVRIVTEAQLRDATAFLGDMAQLISELGYSQLKLQREISERQQTEAALHQTQAEMAHWLAQANQMRQNTLTMLEEQRLAEQQIRQLLNEAVEREFFLQQSQKVGQIGGWRANPNDNTVMWTEGVYDIVEMPLDYQPDMTSGLACYVPESRQQVVENLHRAMAEHQAFNIQVEVLGARTGNRKWVELRGVPHCDAAGQVDYMLGTIQDISERKRSMHALARRAEEQAILLTVGRELSATLEMHHLLQRIVANSLKLTGLDTAAIYFCHDDQLHLQASIPATPADFPPALCHAGLSQHPIIQQVIQSGQIHFIADLQTETLTPEEQQVCQARDLRTALYLPLLVRDAVAGVLIVASTGRTQPLTTASRETYTTYAHMAALAIANAQLYDASRQESFAREQQYAFTHAVLQNAPMGIHMYRLEPNDELIFIGANPAAERILQIDHQQFMGKSIEAAFPPLATTEIPRRYRDIAQRGGIWRNDQIDYDDGNIHGAYQIKAFQTLPGRMAVFFEDVTLMKRHELALQRSEERLRFALKAARQSWFDADIQHGNIEFGPDYPVMLGQGSAARRSRMEDWLSQVHPEDLGNVQHMLQDILQTGGPANSEYRQKTAAGHWLWLRSSGEVTERAADGQPLRMTGIHMDISQRKQMELELSRHKNELEQLVLARTQALNASHQQLQQTEFAMEKVGIGIAWSNSTTGQFAHVNDEVCRQLGYRAEELLQRTVADINPHFNLADYAAALQAIRAAGGNMRFTTEHQRKDGSRFPVEVSTYLYSTPEQDWLIAFHQDISHAKAAENALIEAKQAAEAANIAKSAFLANMSHEIRTPMNAILGMAYLLRQTDDLNPTQLGRLERLEFAGKHLLSLLNDVLDLSKIEAGKIRLDIQPFSPESLLDNANSMMCNQAEMKGLRFEVAHGPLPERLCGDQMRIMQCLINLLGNAIKFTAQGEVSLRLFQQTANATETRLRFEVDDSGIGISTEQLTRLFRPFEQADTSTTRHYGGTGLGLVLTKHLVELMGGTLGVHSQPGQGSHFWFELPFSACAVEPPPALSATSGSTPSTTNLPVLIADDDPTNQEILRTMLQNLGYQVQIAQNGAEAIARVTQQDYALILMDVQMPVLDGLRTSQQLRAQGNTTPIIACTANVFSDERAACLAAGMRDIITKPIQIEALSATLQKYLHTPPGKTDEKAAAPDAIIGPPADADLPTALNLLQALQPLLRSGDFMATVLLESNLPLLHASLDTRLVAQLSKQIERFDSEAALLTVAELRRTHTPDHHD